MCDSCSANVLIELSNIRNRPNFFFHLQRPVKKAKGQKKPWVVPQPPTSSRTLSATFSTWFSSLRVSQLLSQVSFFKNFFFLHIQIYPEVLPKKLKGRMKLSVTEKKTHIYIMNLWFKSPQDVLCIFFICSTKIFLPFYCSRMCINMISLRGDKLKMSMFLCVFFWIWTMYNFT